MLNDEESRGAESPSGSANPFAPFDGDEWPSNAPPPGGPGTLGDPIGAPTDPTSDPERHLAIDLRAETFSEISAGDATRRGELERIEIGRGETNSDTVAGKESIRVHGELSERTGRGLVTTARKIETTVRGRMDIECFEDTTLLGGTVTERWLPGAFTGAVMSDDLAAGAGLRATGSVDLWLHKLMGMEERPGTAAADATMTEFYSTLFEREYGTSVHAAAIAKFSGNVYLASATGFRPLMRITNGVRNLVSGAAEPTVEPPPPSPPAAGAAGAVGAAGMIGAGARGAGNLVGSTAKSSVRMDSITDAGRTMAAIGSAVDNAADLRRGPDTADRLANLQAAVCIGGDFVDVRELLVGGGTHSRRGARPELDPRFLELKEKWGDHAGADWSLEKSIEGYDELARNGHPVAEVLTLEEYWSVFLYTHQFYQDINDALRGAASGGSVDPNWLAIAKIQQGAISKLQDAGQLFQGKTFRGVPAKFVEDLVEGGTAADAGFKSAGLDPRPAGVFSRQALAGGGQEVIFGQSGVPMTGISNDAKEAEILFSPGQEFGVLFKHTTPGTDILHPPRTHLVLSEIGLPPGHGLIGVTKDALDPKMLDLDACFRGRGGLQADASVSAAPRVDAGISRIGLSEDVFNRNMLDLDDYFVAHADDATSAPGRVSIRTDPSVSAIPEIDAGGSRWSQAGSDPGTARVNWNIGVESGVGDDLTVSGRVEVDADSILGDMPPPVPPRDDMPPPVPPHGNVPPPVPPHGNVPPPVPPRGNVPPPVPPHGDMPPPVPPRGNVPPPVPPRGNVPPLVPPRGNVPPPVPPRMRGVDPSDGASKAGDLFQPRIEDAAGGPVQGAGSSPLPPRDYDEGRRVINEQVGDNDIVRAPQRQPEGMDDSVTTYRGVSDAEIDDRLDLAGRRRYELPDGLVDQRVGRMAGRETRRLAAKKKLILQPRRIRVANELWDVEPLARAAARGGDVQPHRTVRFGDVQEASFLVEFEEMRARAGKADARPQDKVVSMQVVEATNTFDVRKAVTYDLDSFETRAGRRGERAKAKHGRGAYGHRWKLPSQTVRDLGYPFTARVQLIDALTKGESVRFRLEDLWRAQSTYGDALASGVARRKEASPILALFKVLKVMQRTKGAITREGLDWDAMYTLLDVIDTMAQTT